MRPFQKKEIPSFEVTIEKLVFEGKALARIEEQQAPKESLVGKVVFVVGDCLPGERVKIQVIKKRKDYMEARVEERLSDSPDRQKAPCKYFGVCGGCFLQNLSYEKQLEQKKVFTQEVFDKILRDKAPQISEVIGSPQEFRYRHKILLNFYVAENNVIELGYYRKGTSFRVIDIDECHLYDERLKQVLIEVRAWARDNELTAFHNRQLMGLLRNVTIRHSQTYDEWMVGIVTTDEEFDSAIWDDLRERLEKIINLKSLYWRMVRVKRAKGEFHHDYHIWGEEYILENLAGLDYQVRFGDFFQNNVQQATNMVECTLDAIQNGGVLNENSKILDLYCGVGTFTLPLTQKFNVPVFGVELVQSAIDSAQKNAELNNISGLEFLCKDVTKIINEVLQKNNYDIVVVDPPRAGLGAIVNQGLMDAEPEQIVYVSCNPATMARDMMALQLKYDVEKLYAFDLFPQTYHVECIAALKLRK